MTPVSDAPVLSIAPASGTEDTSIALNMSAVIGDTDNSAGQDERVTGWVISDIPVGTTFANTAQKMQMKATAAATTATGEVRKL